MPDVFVAACIQGLAASAGIGFPNEQVMTVAVKPKIETKSFTGSAISVN